MKESRAAATAIAVGLGGLASATLLAFAAPLGWPFELFVHFRVQYAAASILLAMALFATRRRLLSGLAVVLAALNALPVLQHARAEPLADACAGRQFTVVTVNVQYSNEDHQPVLSWLADRRPDVVVVQEVSADWARALARLDEYRYRVLVPREDPYGIGILSRWPLSSVERSDFARDGRPSLAGLVDVGGQSLRVLALHTRWPITPGRARARDRALDAAARSLRAPGGPAVVLGDLNATPFSPSYASFVQRSGMREALSGAIWQPTWMAGFWPLALGIDHVFVSPGLCVEHVEVGPAIGSDHRPVLARLRFTVPPRG